MAAEKFPKIEKTEIPGVLLVTPKIYQDHRGYFLETHRSSDFDTDFVQSNVSESGPWTLRGLHYQVHQPQGKLVRVLRGSIFDLAVDLRKGSKTFGHHIFRVLNAQEHRALYVPPGFAHGFLALAQGAMVQYECTTYYKDEDNRTLLWSDVDLGIVWPRVPNGGTDYNISQKDRLGRPFKNIELPVMESK